MGKRMKLDLTDLQEPLADLGKFLKALGPYLNDAILVGGMVPVVYRHLQHAKPVEQKPLTTFDLDIAVPAPLPIEGSGSLQALLSNASFSGRLKGATDPPAIVFQHERHGDGLSSIYVELLTPQVGSGTKRGGKKVSQREIQSGVTAQTIRYLDLLFERPLSVESSLVPDLKISPALDFRVPHPGLFVMQKLLCRRSRLTDKKDKDVAYVYDVLTIFRDSWEEMGETIRAVAGQKPSYRKWIDTAIRDLSSLFESPTSNGPVIVRREISPGGSPVNENTIHRIVNEFLQVAQLRT